MSIGLNENTNNERLLNLYDKSKLLEDFSF